MSSLIMNKMYRYKMINLVGDGTYGLVYLAYNQESKEKVAAIGFQHYCNSLNQIIILDSKLEYYSQPREQGKGGCKGL